MFLVLSFLACPVVRTAAVPPPVESVGVEDDAGAAIAAALVRVDALLGTVDDIDRRDRLVELRDLVVAAQTRDPASRRSIAGYASRVLAIEERASPVGLAESPVDLAGAVPIVTEEAVGAEPAPAVPTPAPPPVDPPVPLAPKAL